MSKTALLLISQCLVLWTSVHAQGLIRHTSPDVNLDGQVNIVDVQLVINAIFQPDNASPARLSIDLPTVNLVRSSASFYRVMGRVRQVGPTALVSVSQCADLLGAGGILIGSDCTLISNDSARVGTSSFLSENVLPIGSTAYFLNLIPLILPDAPVAAVDVRFSYELGNTSAPRGKLGLESVTRAASSSGLFTEISGVLRNTGDVGISFPEVLIALFNSSGSILAIGDTFGESTNLAPGATTPFRTLVSVSNSTVSSMDTRLSFNDPTTIVAEATGHRETLTLRIPVTATLPP